jgi:hypothetical protein
MSLLCYNELAVNSLLKSVYLPSVVPRFEYIG